ncbi:MAG: hypothetical protein ACWIPI_05195, partial [Polaribacter sp.]
MIKKIKHIFLLVTLFSAPSLLAQLDKTMGNNPKGQIKGIVLNNSKAVKKPKSIAFNNKNGFKKAFDKEKEQLKKK